MSSPIRYDEQYCPIARAMDVLGDRWTLLVLRELMAGEQRFSDLRRNLPGIAATVLTDRLRTLTDDGLITTTPLPAPARRSVYALTRRGRQAIPVMAALARFGFPLLDEPGPDTVVRPIMAVHAAVGAYYDPAAAKGVDERYEFRLGEDRLVLSSVRGGGSEKPPRLVLEAAPDLWVRIRQGATTLDQAIGDGELTVTGPKTALAHLRRIFRLDP
jgi:DNA-binding HxlR family transcriptional regulator